MGRPVLPLLAVVIAAGAGFLKWQDAWVRGSKVAGIESVAAREVPEQETVVLGSDEPGHGFCGEPPQDTCFVCEESRYALQPEPSPAPG